MPSLARHTYSPASAGDAWKMYRREPRTWAAVSRMVSGIHSKIQLMPCLWFSQLGMSIPQFRGQDLYMPLFICPSVCQYRVWFWLAPSHPSATTYIPGAGQGDCLHACTM